MTDSTSDRPHALLSDADLYRQLMAALTNARTHKSRANSLAYGELKAEWDHRIDLAEPNGGFPF